MFFKLKPNRNYAYLFFVIVGLVILLGFLFGQKIGGILFFLSFYIIGILQLRSGLVFNRAWTAIYKKEKYPSKFHIIITLCFVFGTCGLITLLLQK